MKRVIICLSFIGLSACGSGNGTTGGGFPAVNGEYELTDITAACTGLFDSEITVIQDDEDIILQAVHSGFQDASGQIDEDGDFTVEGQFGDGTDFTCEGTIIGGVAQGNCSGGGIDCDMTYEEQ